LIFFPLFTINHFLAMAPSVGIWPRGEPLILKEPLVGPYTTPSLTANLVFRVLLSFVTSIVCLVPLRILYRNGEFAAVVLILVLLLKNLETIVDSLLWRDNDMDSWWSGYGLCDIDPYFQHFAIGLFATCLLTIMRNLAQQVGLLRASPMTTKEKRRRNMMQSLIMFPLPVLQVALTWPLTMQRYAVGTLVGCLYMVYPTWLYMVFFVLAPTVVTVLTTFYAGK
jgi:pheromone a factor receptor